jgi:hypothetical protein
MGRTFGCAQIGAKQHVAGSARRIVICWEMTALTSRLSYRLCKEKP